MYICGRLEAAFETEYRRYIDLSTIGMRLHKRDKQAPKRARNRIIIILHADVCSSLIFTVLSIHANVLWVVRFSIQVYVPRSILISISSRLAYLSSRIFANFFFRWTCRVNAIGFGCWNGWHSCILSIRRCRKLWPHLKGFYNVQLLGGLLQKSTFECRRLDMRRDVFIYFFFFSFDYLYALECSIRIYI